MEKSQCSLFDGQDYPSGSECPSTLNIKSERIGQKHISLEWLAGYVDGEGCFQYYGKSQPHLRINSTNYDLMCRIRDAYGGKIYDHEKSKGNQRQTWTWLISKQEAIDLTVLLIPFLKEKQTQAIAILGVKKGEDERNEVLINYLKDEKRTDYTHLVKES